jgi:DNA-directed RNA polymerase subunit F
MIKNKKDFIKSLSKIRPEDEDDLRFVVDRVQKIIDSSNVSEESIKELFKVIQLLLMLHGKFVDYNILWLKQGYMED